MRDKFDIINGALVRIGANEIMSFDDDTVEATTARRLYPNTLDDLLSRYHWRFMSAQVQMARIADYDPAVTNNPANYQLMRWDAAYQIPLEAELVKAVTIGDSSIPFDRYGDRIYCNAGTTDEVILDYVKKRDEQYFPGYFRTLLEFELASGLAIPVGDRGDLAEAYEAKSLRHFALAKNLDAQGRTTKRMKTGRFVGARFGRSYGVRYGA